MKKIVYGFFVMLFAFGFVSLSNVMAQDEGESTAEEAVVLAPSPVSSAPATPMEVVITNAKLIEMMDEENGMGKLAGAALGGAIGLGVGGVATAITAFVEHNNIQCRVGNNLEKVAFGKNGKVKTLKEYYVQWNLRLPDTVVPAITVTDCASWEKACNSIKKIVDCERAAVIYKSSVGVAAQVEAACNVEGLKCVKDYTVASAAGACI
ncbi:MAG: hypothetical protein LBT45_02895 [Rickettsiales bacterium]|jgi:hypothetical protein|nr:hypothetical protein [Rickettsiales bacterium]